MPLDDGCRFDQYHGVEDLRPDSVKPHPEQPVGGEKQRPAGALPTQDGHLVSQSNKLELQRSAAANPEREQGTEGGQKADAHDGMGTAQETLHLVGSFDFCAGTIVMARRPSGSLHICEHFLGKCRDLRLTPEAGHRSQAQMDVRRDV
jgi:hypothetical protein